MAHIVSPRFFARLGASFSLSQWPQKHAKKTRKADQIFYFFKLPNQREGFASEELDWTLLSPVMDVERVFFRWKHPLEAFSTKWESAADILSPSVPQTTS